ncbi:uncharacterized protein LOC115706250 [Cannabis sativa]|uniref:uncharacterized protein LOC115706250 n=1 Tax=Cannabis sativa TaxID=3483 RepID=UPI0029CA532D|nr:uncharacterized protein LOC115706250 [Cannabis sativa]
MNTDSNLEDQYAALNIEEDEEEGLLFEGEHDEAFEIDDRWCLVGRFLTHRSIDFQAMQNKMAQLWQPGRGMYVKELENNLYLFQFYHEVDIERVKEGSPWTFDRVPLLFERLKQGKNPRSVPLNRIDFWVQLHNLTTGFMSETVIRGLGNYLGEYVKSDPNNFVGVWRDYLRIRVKINVTQPLKRKKKLIKQGGLSCHALFKYEDLPTFCFICGVLGHSERFCDRLFDTPYDQLDKPYGLEMKAPPRRRNYAAGARWLKPGIATKTGGASSSDHSTVSNSINAVSSTAKQSSKSGYGQHGINQAQNVGFNQNKSISAANQATRNMEEDFPLLNERPNKESVGKEQFQTEEGGTDMANLINNEEALLIIENKRRRMGFANQSGLLVMENVGHGTNVENTTGPTDLIDVDMDAEANGSTKNLFGAGSGSQTRQEL